MYTVVQGKKIGGKIGFPTLNLEPAKIDADFGVYACEIYFKNGMNLKGVLHYGKRETTDGKLTLEAYLFDFQQKAYGEKVNLKIGQKIREIQKFQNLDKLKIQIQKDIKQVQKISNF